MASTPRCWLHRISYEARASRHLLDEGWLTAAFVDFIGRDFAAATRTTSKEQFDKTFQELWGKTPRTRNNLYRFLKEMSVGDWVVVPSVGSFSIYRIDSDATDILSIDQSLIEKYSAQGWRLKESDPSRGLHIGEGSRSHVDIGFVRKVSVVRTNIARSAFADAALTSRMKIRLTTADISDLFSSVRQALEAAELGKPLNIHETLHNNLSAKVLDDIRTKLNPDKFERLLASYFKRLGASDVERPAKNGKDKVGDVDVMATFDGLRTVYHVQAKFHTNITGDQGTQQIQDFVESLGQSEDYSMIAWVVSTADSFSSGAVAAAQGLQGDGKAQRVPVRLIAGPEFAGMLLDAGLATLSEVG